MSVLAAIVFLTNAAFTVAFDTETRCPAWVAYDLEPCEVVVTNRIGRVRVPDGFCKVVNGWFGVRQWRVSNLPTGTVSVGGKKER